MNKLHLQRNALNKGCIVQVHLVAALKKLKFTWVFKFFCICLQQKKKKRIHTTCCAYLIPSAVLFLDSCRHPCPSTSPGQDPGCLPSRHRAPGGQGQWLRIQTCRIKGRCATSRHLGGTVWMLKCWDLQDVNPNCS